MTPTFRRHLLLPLGLAGVVLSSSPAFAASSATGEEYLSTGEYAPPNILFVIDRSGDMASPCDSSSTESCLDTVKKAIGQVVQHYDWARYGVVGTSSTSGSDDYYPIAPLGSSHAEIIAALSSVSSSGAAVRNFAEVFEDLGQNYFSITTPGDGVDGDGDGIAIDWADAPIQYSCQATHIVVITRDRPRADNGVTASWKGSISPDVKCNTDGITTGTDTLCLYDNVAYSLYTRDMNSSLTGTQNVTVHTVGIGIDTSSVAETVYGNTSDVLGGAGIYNVAANSSALLGSILTVIQDIRTGTYSRSTPIVSATGDYLIYTFYELTGDNPLAQGHIRGYEINVDPDDPDYGQIVYDETKPQFGGAVWDGGDLLVSRPVFHKDYNPGDHDGVGLRDIYTYLDEAATLSGLSMVSAVDRRQPLDAEFVSTVASSSTVANLVLDWNAYGSATCTPGTGPFSEFDFDEDCAIDSDDMQAMVDFLRGRPESTFRYINQARGYWKLGDAPYGVPAVVEPRLNNAYSMEPSYRKFLSKQQAADFPRMVFMAANDGMLHAFYLDDLPGTAHSEAGEEAWAWMPGYLLYRDKDPAWAGRAVDQMLYGRTFLFDGSPVVADVWIDHDGDGKKECTSIDPGSSVWPDCEWHRVLVVQQGKGGPLTMALDITDPLWPKFLWEQWDTGEPSAVGYGVSRAVVAQIRDNEETGSPTDRYIALWGSGRAVPQSESATGYQSTEANLYMWNLGDGPWASSDGWTRKDLNPRGTNIRVDSTVPDVDGDGAYEQAYIGAALAVVDVDSDGDADVVYFPVSTTYRAADEGGSGPASASQLGDTSYIRDPGSTFMYKACMNTENPDDLTWARFYDPIVDGGLSRRPEVYYAATTSWHRDGSLGVYWGTGTPYSRTTSDNGYFFAVRDLNPKSCTSISTEGVPGCGATGVYPLDPGEGLTGEPIIYAGAVYFSTWVPESDLCDGGKGRVYGISYADCGPAMDTNGNGVLDSGDTSFVEYDSYVSGVTVTEQGNLVYGIADADMDGNDIGFRSALGDPFLGTATLAWMEVF